MKKSIALLGTITAMGLAVPAANATTTVNIGTYPPANPYFFTTSVTPGTTSLTADFGDTIHGANTAFDDIFTFKLPVSGVGSGSVSTSFSSAANFLSISSVLINGMTYSAAAAAAGVNGIPIVAGQPNTLEVIGMTGAGTINGTFSGTATFSATPAVPEPATWATFLVGFGFMGFALRRKVSAKFQTA